MNVQMININTKKVEISFDIEVDRSKLDFTKRLIEVLSRDRSEKTAIEIVEREIVIDSMRNSGMFKKYPRCFVVFS